MRSISKKEYLDAKSIVWDYEFNQMDFPSGILPSEKTVENMSDKYMNNFSASPKLYHKRGATWLLKHLKDRNP